MAAADGVEFAREQPLLQREAALGLGGWVEGMSRRMDVFFEEGELGPPPDANG